MALVALPLHAQLPTDKTPPESSESAPAPKWQPPDLANLPVDWWKTFETLSPDIANQRLKAFLASIEERIKGLGADDLVTAHNSLANLKNLVELLDVAAQGPTGTQFEPVLSKESYSLDELLALRAQWRGLEKQAAQINLEMDQTRRQVELLRQRRDSMLRVYNAKAVESPGRILSGLNLVSVQIEYQLALKRSENLQKQLEKVQQQKERVNAQLTFAHDHLNANGLTLKGLEAAVADAQARVTEMTEKMAAAQKRLLDAISGTEVNPSLELLRKQQVTRISTEMALDELQQAVARTRLEWYRVRSGLREFRVDSSSTSEQQRRQTEEILNQLEVWAATSQTTLVTSPTDDSLNTVKNLEIARSVARDTLELIEKVRDTSDDLSLLRGVLSSELVNTQSGLSKAWLRLAMISSSIWNNLSNLLDFHLFSIGNASVTLGGIIQMLLIMVLAFFISWFIRHLLGRVSGRQQFASSPAIYTLGRVLHYVIILVGTLAALGSVGMDFSNFALIAGALSVGIGFGLQAIVNNFVSGLILLFEGSLRIGDYIELDGSSGMRLAGVVREINTRATVVNTNDSVDVVVPNSELVTSKLTNWTLRESFARVHIQFGVAYGSDKEKVKELALDAATEMDFVLLNMPGREPAIRLMNFGDNALEFELRAWVSRQGVRRPYRVRSSFLWALETRFREAGIKIPFPQRDIHMVQDEEAPLPFPQDEQDTAPETAKPQQPPA
ncbi:MAG: mechanosensitive ion channel [Lysobacterales bacterium]|jgi:small-conductance mechanosensitive channel